MKYRVIILPKAVEDFIEIDEWLTRNTSHIAVKWLNGMLNAIHSLEENPRRCTFALENGCVDIELRQMLYGRYRIIYSVHEKKIYIHSIRHSARQILNPEDIQQNEAK